MLVVTLSHGLQAVAVLHWCVSVVSRWVQYRVRMKVYPPTSFISRLSLILCLYFLFLIHWYTFYILGVVVNQCADLTVARAQNRLFARSGTTGTSVTGTAMPGTTGPDVGDGSFSVYLILLRWIKSRAYVVSTDAENSNEPLEPQPGYTCHVSTWSRIDPLDPSKLSLERAFQMAQVGSFFHYIYIYIFEPLSLSIGVLMWESQRWFVVSIFIG